MEESQEDILPKDEYCNNENEDENKSSIISHIRKPNRKIVVEPILFILTLFGFPLMQVSQLFVYGKIKDYVVEIHGYNKSSFSTTHNLTACEVNKSSFEYQFTQEVQTYNTYFSMIGSLLMSVPSIFVTMFLGSYSDKAGRKYAIVPPIIGGFLVTSIYLVTVFWDLPLWCIWIAEFIAGISGGIGLLFVGCYSYIADITTKEQRQFRITVVELVTFLFGILGPIGVGYLIKKQGYLWPVVVSFGGHAINLIYVIFFVPETVIKQQNVKFFTLAHIKHSVHVLMTNTLDKRRWKLWLLLLTFIIHRLGSGAYYGITRLFELNSPLCWGAVTIGYYSTVSIGAASLGGLISAKLLKCCVSDAGIALIASITFTLGLIYKGFVQNTVMMFASCAFSPFGMLLSPTTRTLISKLVAENEQGAVFSALSILEHITELVSSEVFKVIYVNTLYISTGFVFFIGAIFYFIVALLLIVYIVKLSREPMLFQRLETIE